MAILAWRRDGSAWCVAVILPARLPNFIRLLSNGRQSCNNLCIALNARKTRYLLLAHLGCACSGGGLGQSIIMLSLYVVHCRAAVSAYGASCSDGEVR